MTDSTLQATIVEEGALCSIRLPIPAAKPRSPYPFETSTGMLNKKLARKIGESGK